ncbi:uncharacterized protein LOC129249250 [Anastrepha obliqua]|uniref:uncharacterized protein LOC129249250 n=1 Tax=Anastrepha obliqua TaxID=95512 RepID=UPI00240A8D0D|nr:uncharacterized protein LOC129249250 [Anastrepha obliqua]
MRQLYRHYAKVPTLLLGFTCFCLQLAHTQGYSQVLVSGSGSTNNEGPKIFKAINMDLIYPRTFNSSEDVISTTETLVKPQQQHDHQVQPMASEQPILYVTPATDNVLPTAHHEATSIKPVLAVDNEQQAPQQSDAYETPSDTSLADTLPPLQEYASTGRAIDYNSPAYNFNKLITPLIKSPSLPAPPSVRERPALVSSPSQATSNIGQIIYPHAYSQQQPPNRAEISKLTGKAEFSDRFTPGEAVAAGQFAKHRQQNSDNKKASASQIRQQIYVPPKNTYSFPPNLNAQYPSPYQDPKAALPSSNVNSYVAPPSGPVQANANYPLVAAASSNDSGYTYKGPLNPDSDDAKNAKPAPAEDQKGVDSGDSNSDDTIGVLPASAMGDADKDMDGKGAGMDSMNAGVDDAGAMADGVEQDHPPPTDDTEYPTPPPGWLEQHPDTLHDSPHNGFHHDLNSDPHFDLHDHFPSYPQYFHHYPEIIWDDHHYHHHDHTAPPPPTLPPITTEAPPPEPPPEPRVKKYSYFYIGRKLWYIPLYFTVWFSFYVLWLIIKSIARHKVNLPNHYVSKRSLLDYPGTETQANEYINDLTVSVLEKIEKFRQKYQT